MAWRGNRRLCLVLALTVLGSCRGPLASNQTDELMRAGLDALYQRNDPGTAVADFEKLLAIKPDHYGASFQLAVALERAGRADQARPVWLRVKSMAERCRDNSTAAIARQHLGEKPPDRVETLMSAGLAALYGQHDPAAAAVAFRQALALNPEHYGANFQLATALDQAGKAAEARPYWEKVLKLAEAYKDLPTIDTARRRLAR